MKQFFTFLFLAFCANSYAVPLTDSTKKVQVWIDGRVDATAFVDTYRSVDNSGGIQYRYPMRPRYDEVGLDVNNEPSLRFGIASSRLGLGASSRLSKKVTVGAYVQVDMMGPFQNGVGSLRLRHAYAKVDIGNSRITVGQTSHLMHVDEIAPNLVTFGSGSPFNPLNRPIQFRFSQTIGRFNIAAAASMFTGDLGTMQSKAMTPDFSARLMYTAPSGFMVGAVGGFQSIAPQLEGISKGARANIGYVELFGRYSFGKGYGLTLSGVYGGNLASLGMTGGIAPTINRAGYSAINTISGWLYFNTKSYSGFQFYLFGGYQTSLGAGSEIDKSKVMFAQNAEGLSSFWRIAPSMWYHYKMLSFGLEYMYTQAVWAHTLDNNYVGTSFLEPVGNNRVTLLARFKF